MIGDDGAEMLQLILQWQENSEPGVLISAAAKGTGDPGIKLFFFKMLALL